MTDVCHGFVVQLGVQADHVDVRYGHHGCERCLVLHVQSTLKQGIHDAKS